MTRAIVTVLVWALVFIVLFAIVAKVHAKTLDRPGPHSPLVTIKDLHEKVGKLQERIDELKAELYGPPEIEVQSYSPVLGCDAACIECESGGNPQAYNPNGHWGLFQFDYQTWVAHGGDPDEYGSAGSAEQTRVAANIDYDAWACN